MTLSSWIRSFKPPADREGVVVNPLTVLRAIDLQGYLFIFAGWVAWTADGADYFAPSLTIKLLSAQFNQTTTAITTSITLTLLFRSLGAVVFGLLSDRFGRKWTLIGNLLLCAVFELGSGFANDFGTFLAMRCLFGAAMGGIWGQAANTALENVPAEARGLVSGFVQQGYAVGYLIAAVVNLYVVPSHSWRTLFFINTGITVFAALVRLCLPESPMYLRAQEEAKKTGVNNKGQTKAFFRECGTMLKTHWKRCIWAVLLMTGFNFLSHGSQDLYPTYLQVTKNFSSALSSKATIIANCGAFSGGILFGYISQFTGRRLAILGALLWVACFIPLWILPSSFSALSAGAFFLQFGVQGAWGVIPIYLSENSPPAFRASFAGIAYQLGNMISSAAAQIEARAGESLVLKANGVPIIKNGATIPDYASVQGILIGCVIAWTMVCVLVGPEHHGSHFEEAKVAFQEGAGLDDAGDHVEKGHTERDIEMGGTSSPAEAAGSEDYEEKGKMDHVERV